jgi:hypothetical protein
MIAPKAGGGRDSAAIFLTSYAEVHSCSHTGGLSLRFKTIDAATGERLQAGKRKTDGDESPPP